MPKFGCRCGCVMNLSIGWSDYELTLIPESAVEALARRVDSGGPMTSEQFLEDFDKHATCLYRCPQCNRLYVQESSGEFITYIQEVSVIDKYASS